MSERIGNLDPVTLVSCLSNEILHLVLLPTEACNFRCVYCYEDFRYKRMEPWVVRGVKELVRRRSASLSHLTISWFGGEPLLARDVIEDVMEGVCEVSRIHPGIRVRSDATTNGYLLTRRVAERLLDLGVSTYQISFDGPREYHDRKRVLAGGKGTFDRIWANLLALRELDRDFTITIRVHVDRTNAGAIPQFIDQCAAEFGGDARFEMFIRGLSRLGGPNDADLSIFEKEEGEAVYEELRGYARSRRLRTMSALSSDYVCYAARANSFVVRANGRLNKCTVALEHPNNQVGRIREDGTVEIDPSKMVQWMRGVRSGNAKELKCPMKGYAEPETKGGAIRLAVSLADRVRTAVPG
jgi:uncharacterized protein